jgi:ankyrin repeat protein
MRSALDDGADPDALLALSFVGAATIRTMPLLPHAKALAALPGPAPAVSTATPSMLCAALGRPEALALLLARGARPNPQGKRSLAGIACARGHLPTLLAALQGGCPPAIPDDQGREPLCEAVAQGQAKMAELLLSRTDTDPNAQDGLGRSALHAAAAGRRPDLIALLARHGAHPNIQDDRGRTPLHLAAALGCAPTIQALWAAGANLEAFDKKSRTPLMAACRVANGSGIAPLLELGANPNALGPHPRDASRPPQTALGYALVWGRVQSALDLLAAGADPNQRFSDIRAGFLPLQRALSYGHKTFRDVFSALISAGADPDADTTVPYGSSLIPRRVLNIALSGPRYEASKLALFLTARPDLEYRDDKGRTPLEALALEPEWRPPGYYAEACDALLRAGALITPRLMELLDKDLGPSAKAIEFEIKNSLARHATSRAEAAQIAAAIDSAAPELDDRARKHRI